MESYTWNYNHRITILNCNELSVFNMISFIQNSCLQFFNVLKNILNQKILHCISYVTQVSFSLGILTYIQDFDDIWISIDTLTLIWVESLLISLHLSFIYTWNFDIYTRFWLHLNFFGCVDLHMSFKSLLIALRKLLNYEIRHRT